MDAEGLSQPELRHLLGPKQLQAASANHTLFTGSAPTPSYMFFSAVEIGTTAFIVWYAWTWPKAAAAATAGSDSGAGMGHGPWTDSASTRKAVGDAPIPVLRDAPSDVSVSTSPRGNSANGDEYHAGHAASRT